MIAVGEEPRNTCRRVLGPQSEKSDPSRAENVWMHFVNLEIYWRERDALKPRQLIDPKRGLNGHLGHGGPAQTLERAPQVVEPLHSTP